MRLRQYPLSIETTGRGSYELTGRLAVPLRESGIRTGLAQLFLHHTSASLIVSENADPAVHRDLERFLARLVPDGDPLFEHDAEGPDDMPAHVRSVLTAVEVCMPVTEGRLALGTWQGVYLFEHRTAPHQRRLTLTVLGE